MGRLLHHLVCLKRATIKMTQHILALRRCSRVLPIPRALATQPMIPAAQSQTTTAGYVALTRRNRATKSFVNIRNIRMFLWSLCIKLVAE